ncbi:MAG: DNA repair exonuclease [Thiotrichaceae bacterium]
MKFVHAADLHLDSPLCGLARYENAPLEQMHSATRRALVNLVNLACHEQVDFVIFSGDLYDGDWKDYNTGLFFNQQMCRLRDQQIQVFIVYGNHDADNGMTKRLRLPDNVHVFSSSEPQTQMLEHLGVALHGQSFATRAVTEDLSARYPAAIPEFFNIGVLHTALNGREGHAPYAPCTLTNLTAQGYDYWALGHVHRRDIVAQQPYIVFPGNLQGRHSRETGAKGCFLVTVAAQQVVDLTFYALDVMRWELCTIDTSELIDIEVILDKTRDIVLATLQQADNKPLALRFILSGSSAIHAELHRQTTRWVNELRSVVSEVGNGNVWVEKVQLHTQPLRQTRLPDGPLQALVETLHSLPQDAQTLQELGSQFRPLKNALPSEVTDFDPQTLQHALPQVEALLLARLRMTTG